MTVIDVVRSGPRPVQGGWSLRGYKGKGGGSARQPVEASDSLHSTSYARVLDLLSEGEILGLVNGLQSIYLNETPLQNADGSMNFQGVQVDFRAGTQWQDPVPGFPASESTASVNVELKYGTPWVRAINNRNLSAVRVTLGVNGLRSVDTNTGDINGYSVQYAIDLQTDGGVWVEVINTSFSGKTTAQYRRTHRIDLPVAASGWAVRVRRLTANAVSDKISDTTVIDSLAEVIDAKLRYPMSALAGLQIDASQFNAVPTRAYHLRGRIIKVPTNYDPATRIYTGVWDGTFKTAYSNNPAWVFYDLVLNDRYGLGRRIPAAWLNKWALYQIAAYCDELVPDGRGGTEPRFTCNVYLQQRGDATRVLQDLCSVFRGMVYWAAGTAVPVADMPRDPVYTYTQANVIDGRFVYTGSRRKDRNTVALVSYNDMKDMARQKLVYVQDDEGVARYGVRQTEISAFGCTSEAQAYRVGQWALLTAKRETQSVSFSVGLDGTLCAPGQIIRIADNMRAGRRIGGRIRSATKTTIEIDAELGIQYGDELTVILPSGVAETRKVSKAYGVLLTADLTTYTVDSTELTADMISLPGTTMTVVVETEFSAVPRAQSVWALEAPTLKTQLYTVMSVAEGEGITFDITAVQHQPGKFSAIDHGTRLDPRPITIVPPKVQPAPGSVTLTSFNVVRQGISSQTAAIRWEAAESAVLYEVEWRRNDSDWVRAGRTTTTGLEIDGAYAGTYVARVRAINSIDVPSAWTQSTPTMLDGILSAPPAVTNLAAVSQVFGIGLSWGLPQGVNIIQRTELWYSQANDLTQAIKLGDFSYPQNTHTMLGLAAGAAFFFWARLVDKNGLAGPWYPTVSGVQGKASSDASLILDYIKGQITETQLSQALLEKIEGDDGALVEVEAIKNALAAMYTIKTQLTVDGKPYMAGIGVGVENNQGVVTSQILLAAQRVAVLNEANGSTSVPFVIQDGVTYINSAFIKTASIGSAKFADVTASDALVNGQPVYSINWRTGVQKSVSLNGGIRSEQGSGYWFVTDTSTGVVVLEIDARA
ncbi:MAG: host specificity protein J [Comamonas sp.]